MVYDKACSHQRTPKMHVLGWEYTMCLESRHRPKINREHNWDSLCDHLEIERIFTRDCYDLCRFSTSIPKLETTTFAIRKHLQDETIPKPVQQPGLSMEWEVLTIRHHTFWAANLHVSSTSNPWLSVGAWIYQTIATMTISNIQETFAKNKSKVTETNKEMICIAIWEYKLKFKRRSSVWSGMSVTIQKQRSLIQNMTS